MNANRKTLIPVLASALLLYACAYIVVPDVSHMAGPGITKGWTGVATGIDSSEAGGLHIDLTIRNETGDWSAMQSVAGHPAVLTAADGKTANCDTVYVGSGGHRLAPGFRMRGYIGGTNAEPVTQLLYVECAGAEFSAGSKLTVEISYVMGEYNYFYPDNNRVEGTIEVNLDEVAAGLAYPIAEPIEGLIQKPGTEIGAINDNAITLIDVQRTEAGLQFTWQNSNPSAYPLRVHIGIPPVIGADGIIYGQYETPDLESPPVTPAGATAEWTTDVAVPADIAGLYILLSVESKQQRLFVNYAVDITDK